MLRRTRRLEQWSAISRKKTHRHLAIIVVAAFDSERFLYMRAASESFQKALSRRYVSLSLGAIFSICARAYELPFQEVARSNARPAIRPANADGSMPREVYLL